MNALAASLLPAGTGTLATTDLPETAESAEPEAKGKEKDSDDDALTAEDDELLAALQLTGVPVPAPVAVNPAEAATSDAVLDALSGGQKDSSQTASPSVTTQQQPATTDPASQFQIKAQDLLLPNATVSAASDTLTKTADPDARASVDTVDSKGTLPSQLHALAAHAQTAADADVPREIRAPIGTHAWTRQLGDELAWMMQQGREAASLKLSPEHLGPLEVRISMQDGGASVWFGASHADTRAALEQALPKLREMFASQGLALADAGVFKEAPRQQQRSPSFNSNAAGTEAATQVTSAKRATAGLRLLDTYA
jgi:flagellar hook-length control protein FliK